MYLDRPAQPNRPVRCPACGLELPSSGAVGHKRLWSSPECSEQYGQLSAYLLSLAEPGFPYQYAADAYAAQHASLHSKPITTVFALIGLYLACDRHYSGRQVQRVHQLLARRKPLWPDLILPIQRGSTTVQDVLRAPPGPPRMAALLTWCGSVWGAWAHERSTVENFLAEHLET